MTANPPATLANRYTCPNEGKPGAGLVHDRGNGQPPRLRCRTCKGVLAIHTGLWGVFEWEGGNGRYREEDAIELHTRHGRAQHLADRGNRVTPEGGNLVVRWIPKEAPIDTS
jgi:hypothetical protein